jgi:sec-independent protein translocase protein TatB
MFGIGMTEMIVIGVIALVVLGPKRLPELARTLGRTLGEFRRSATDLRREFSDVMDESRIDPPKLSASKPDPPPGANAPGQPEGGTPAAQAASGEPSPGSGGTGGAANG